VAPPAAGPYPPTPADDGSEADQVSPDGSAAADRCTVHEGMRHLVQLLPRVMRGIRRHPTEPVPTERTGLGPRHGSALALLREGQTTVGGLASRLELTLATVSGLVGDLERVGFVERSTDPTDRRRTIVRVVPSEEGVVDAWLDGASAPIARALRRLSPEERATFVKAMGYLDAEVNAAYGGSEL
jgi:DNA-binding MarR family transcriptional regulator